METMKTFDKLSPEQLMERMRNAARMKQVLRILAMFDFIGMKDLAFDFKNPQKEKIEALEKLQQEYADKNAERYVNFSNIEFGYNPENDNMEYEYYVGNVVETKKFKKEEKMREAMKATEFVSQGVRKSDGTFNLNIIDLKKTDKADYNLTVSYPLAQWMETFKDAIEANELEEIIKEYVVFCKERYALDMQNMQ